MLNQTQFIENRVYDDEEEDEPVKAAPPATNSEEDMVQKFKNALSKGLGALSSYTPPAISSDMGDDPDEAAASAPNDYYNKKPLPFVIATRACGHCLPAVAESR